MNNYSIFEINKLFDFNTINRPDNISNCLHENICFLSNLTQKKSYGRIERLGDLFYGIKNKELFPINICIFYSYYKESDIKHPDHTDKMIDSFTLAPNETYILQRPLLMIKLHQQNNFFFRIKRTDTLNKTIYNSIPAFFSPIDEIFNTEFIYGYLTKETRTKLVNTDCFCEYNNRYYFYPLEGFCTDWLDIVRCFTNRKINNDYFNLFLNHEIPQHCTIHMFKKMNPRWLEIK